MSMLDEIRQLKTIRTTALAAIASITFLSVGAVQAQNPVASTSTKTASARPLSPEDVLSLRDIRELQISPDGKSVAFVVTEPADPKAPLAPRTANIWIVPTDGSTPPRPLIPNLKNATSPRWFPDGQSVAFLSNRGDSSS